MAEPLWGRVARALITRLCLIASLAAFLGGALAPAPAHAQALPREVPQATPFGHDRTRFSLGKHDLTVFTYRPLGCASPSILFVFHGNGRSAESYLQSAQPLADTVCLIVYAPLFDADRYPSWRYHRGGVVENGSLRAPETWTVSILQELLDWARARDGWASDVYLFGHSAGGQFLSRVAAYGLPYPVARIVIANPSTYVLPSIDEAMPYGFGWPTQPAIGSRLKSYLEAPITIYLGQDDTGSKDLTMNESAVRQGSNRLDRGRRTFEMARSVARDRGWGFGWSLVEAEGAGHSARAMLGHAAIAEALGFTR